MRTNSAEFLALLASGMPENERLILCGFRGDPNAQRPDAWRPRPWRPGQLLPFDPPDNAYVTVASFGRTADRTFRRRREAFAAGRALLVDDVGTKVAASIVSHASPTAIVETSPGNYQWWYILSEPERDPARFDGVIRAFISAKLLGADPGMSGVTRVGRLPGFTNGKPQHKGFRTVLSDFDPKRLFTVPKLLRLFDLTIEGKRYDPAPPPRDIARSRVQAFFEAKEFLERRNMLKRKEPDLSGWIECSCPWRHEHTGSVDNGAALRMPHLDNKYYGAFKCWHGHCEGRGWPDLTEWVNDMAVEELQTTNERAADSGRRTQTVGAIRKNVRP